MAFMAGDFVGIRCEVQPGPFDGEHLVTVNTVNGPITGFVARTELRKSGSQWEVRGKIEQVDESTIKVMIYGSFFTTNGIASISRELAMAA